MGLVLLLALLGFSQSVLAQPERGGPEHSGAEDHFEAPSYSGADFIGGANLHFLKGENISSDSDILNRDKFVSTLEVNTNRGSLSVSFKLPLPPNLLGKKELTFKYNHRKLQNSGFGTGFVLELSELSKEFNGDINLNESKYVKSFCPNSNVEIVDWAFKNLLHAEGLDKKCYRGAIESDFYVLYEGVKGYVLFTRGKSHYVFNDKGQLVYELDNYKNKLSYKWDGVKLIEISDELTPSKATFNYSGKAKLPVFKNSVAYDLPARLESISFKHKNFSKKALFSYDGEYLQMVKWENGFKSLFKSSYDLIKGKSEESSISSLEEDEIYLTEDDPNSVSVKNIKDAKKISLFIDLNGDFRLDKFEFDSEAYKNKVTDYLKKLEFKHNGRSGRDCKVRPKKSIAEVEKDLSEITMPVSFYWAYVDDKGSFRYKKDERLSTHSIAPGLFKFKTEIEKRETCDKIFYYSVDKVYFKKPVAIDINHNELKDVLWISPSTDEKLNLAGKIYHILKNKSFKDRAQSESEIWLTKLDKKKLSELYSPFGSTKENVVTEVRDFEISKGPRISGDAMIIDLNKDGYDDILEGNRVLLQDDKGTFHAQNLTQENIKDYFRVDDSVEGEEDKFTFSFVDGKIQVLKGESAFGLRDFDILTVDDVVFKTTPGSSKKLLKGYYTSFGGEFEVDYINQNKTQLVSTIIKKDSKLTHNERNFFYTDSMFDFYTGVFVGFEKTKEIIQSASTQDQKIVERQFLSDAYPGVVLFEPRARLQGRLYREIESTLRDGPFLKKSWNWDGNILDNKRIYILPTTADTERLNFQGKTTEVLRVENEVLSWNEESFINENQTITFQATDLVKMSDKGEVSRVIKSFKTNENGLLLLSQKNFITQNSNKKKNYFYNKEGSLIQEILNNRVGNYFYDNLGRPSLLKDFKGLETKLTYKKNEIAPSIITSGDETVEIERENVFGNTTSQEFLGKKYLFSYNKDFENNRISLLKNGVVTTMFSKSDFMKSDEGLIPFYQLQIKDKVFDVTLDAFGTPVMASEDFHGQKRIVFNQKVFDDYVTESSSGYFEDDYSRELTSFTYNAKGETLTKVYTSLNLTISHFNKYADGCTSSEVNGKEISFKCQNLLGKIVNSDYLDESATFDWSGEGKLIGLGNSHFWSLDHNSEVNEFSFENESYFQEVSEDARFLTSGNKKLEFDSKGREVKLTLDQRTTSSSFKNGLLASLVITDQGKKLYEESYSYKNDLLVKIKSPVFEKSFEYDEFERVSLESIKTNNIESSLRYKLQDGEVLEIDPFIKDIEYDASLRISAVTYGTGLVTKFSYHENTSLTKSIEMVKENEAIYSDISSYNELGELIKHDVYSPSFAQAMSETYHYKNFVLQDGPSKAKRLNVLDETHHCGEYICKNSDQDFYYLSSMGLKFGINDSDSFLFINTHEAIIKNDYVKLIEIKGMPLGVLINKNFYPVVTNHKKEVIGLVNTNGDKVLFLRKFDLVGNKKLITEGGDKEVEKLDNLVVWSFGRLRHNPLDEKVNKDLYWSMSRTYSTKTTQWTAVDPLVAWNPSALVNNPGNWNPYSYCNGDSVNCVDTSGYYTIKVGIQVGGKSLVGASYTKGVYVSLDANNNLQFGTFKNFNRNMGLQLGASVDIKVGISNADNASEVEGVDSGLGGGGISGHWGIGGGLGASYSKAKDDKKIIEVEGTLGFGIGGGIGIGFGTTDVDVWKDEANVERLQFKRDQYIEEP